MKKNLWLVATMFLFGIQSFAQTPFEYQLQITPVTVNNLPGLHSLAVAQHDGKWLLIGGRKDGMHARQPFNTFPVAYNNTSIYVVDVNANMVWSAPLTSLSVSMQEQLQSTNTNFYQDHDSLYVLGGYAFSATANDFITFDKMTSIDVPGLMNAIINNSAITTYFKQISDPIFKNTGGQMGKIGNTFYLVGGQDFQGQYNPMGNPTYTQTYHAQYSTFTINNSGNQLSIANLQTTTDAINLRRRDYNLVPQIFPDGTEGYMISSGVFQPTVNLPFLYPVNITATGYQAIPSFNQYLSNYQSAKVALWDSLNNRMHNLFFGGISQYYMLNGTLTQDVNVALTKSISRVTRMTDSTLSEVEMNVAMPDYLGAGSEFFPNQLLPHTESEIIKLNTITADTFLVGHIYGGIKSATNNPFTTNQTAATSANTTIYKVELIKNKNGNPESVVDGKNPYDFAIYPNPTDGEVQVQFELKKLVELNYFITTLDGKLLAKNEIAKIQTGANNIKIPLGNTTNQQALMLTLVFENKYFVTHKIMIK